MDQRNNLAPPKMLFLSILNYIFNFAQTFFLEIRDFPEGLYSASKAPPEVDFTKIILPYSRVQNKKRE